MERSEGRCKAEKIEHLLKLCQDTCQCEALRSQLAFLEKQTLKATSSQPEANKQPWEYLADLPFPSVINHVESYLCPSGYSIDINVPVTSQQQQIKLYESHLKHLTCLQAPVPIR